MPALIFNIRHQRINRVDCFLPARYSKNYLYAEFNFLTQDWEGVPKTAVFKSQKYSISVVLGESDTCLVPHEVLEETKFSVSVFGGNLITVDSEEVKVFESGYRSDLVEPPTPDVYTQILTALNGKADDLRYENNILYLMANNNAIASVKIVAGSGGSGTDGREVELRNNGEYIQWRYSGEEDWVNLVALADLKGEKGDNYVLTDEDIEKIASRVHVETSADKITYDDSQTQLGATNVQDAIGKVSEQKVDKQDGYSMVSDSEKQAWNNKSDFSGSYNDLTDKPEIPEGADLTGYATEDYVKDYAQPKGNYLTEHQDLSGYALKEEIPTVPEKLPNPNPLTFTGAVTGTYDGSKALNVEIPSGGSVGGRNTWEQIAEIEITENVQQYVISKDMNGESFELEKVAILMKVEKTTSQMDVSCSVTGSTLQKIKAVTTSTANSKYGYAVFENKGFGLFPTFVKSSRADGAIGELQDTSNVWPSLNTTNNSYDGPETCKAVWIGSHYQTVLLEGTIIKVMGVRK